MRVHTAPRPIGFNLHALGPFNQIRITALAYSNPAAIGVYVNAFISGRFIFFPGAVSIQISLITIIAFPSPSTIFLDMHRSQTTGVVPGAILMDGSTAGNRTIR